MPVSTTAGKYALATGPNSVGRLDVLQRAAHRSGQIRGALHAPRADPRRGLFDREPAVPRGRRGWILYNWVESSPAAQRAGLAGLLLKWSVEEAGSAFIDAGLISSEQLHHIIVEMANAPGNTGVFGDGSPHVVSNGAKALNRNLGSRQSRIWSARSRPTERDRRATWQCQQEVPYRLSVRFGVT